MSNESGPEFAQPNPFESSVPRTGVPALHLNAGQAAELADAVARLSQAGLPLEGALKAVADELPRGNLATALGEVAARLTTGQPLATALSEQTTGLPSHLAHMIAAGLRSGNLPGVLMQYVAQQRRWSELQRQMRAALIYPMVVATAASLLVAFYLHFVLDDINEFNSSMTESRSSFTDGVTAASGPLKVLLLVVAVALPLTLPFLGWITGHPKLRGLLNSLPLIGELGTNLGVLEFCEQLALMLDAKLPLDQALQLTSEALRDRSLARYVDRMAEMAAHGAPLSECIRGQEVAPLLVPLVQWGERSQQVPAALRMAADSYQLQLRGLQAAIRMVVPNLVLFAVAIVMALLLMATYLPMLQLIEALT